MQAADDIQYFGGFCVLLNVAVVFRDVSDVSFKIISML
jgi:hypothetical protein